MAGLMEWNPIREIDEFARKISSGIFKDKSLWPDGERTTTVWSPEVDIVEEETEFVIKAEIPEVPKDAIKVTLENGVLSLSGYRIKNYEKKGARYHRIEREYGDFIRSFSLPENADSSKVSANLKDGVLTVRIGKNPETHPSPIDIKVG